MDTLHGGPLAQQVDCHGVDIQKDPETMKRYRFLGDPLNYRWDFPLVTGEIYHSNLAPFSRHTVQELMDMAIKYKDHAFLAEWEEVTTI